MGLNICSLIDYAGSCAHLRLRRTRAGYPIEYLNLGKVQWSQDQCRAEFEDEDPASAKDKTFAPNLT